MKPKAPGQGVLLAAGGMFLLPAAVLWLVSERPKAEWSPRPLAIARRTTVKVRASNPHGFRSVRASLEQNGRRTDLYSIQNPATRFTFRKGDGRPREVTFIAGQDLLPELAEGKARLIVEITANDFRAATERLEADVDVVFRPPSVMVVSSRIQVAQGGSGVAVFTPVGSWAVAGVRVGDRDFPSYPLPGSNTSRFALFGLPHNAGTELLPVVFARNRAGMEATAPLNVNLVRVSRRKRDLKIDDRFLRKVTAELDPEGGGSQEDRYARMNRELRARNNRVLESLTAKSEPRLLIAGSLERWPGASVQSQFADLRTYNYRGRKLDEQVHLGVDLASTRQAPVTAAGDGKVVFAEPLGIYGKCVVVDHGCGLQSIYAHLSSIRSKPGDLVRKGQELGLSGATGLAGGDHLHFSVQVGGLMVNPFEWWNPKWTERAIFSQLAGTAPALPGKR